MMHIRLVAVATLVSIPAVAKDGWDVEEEMATRAWRSASLTWAQDISPEPIPTQSWLQTNVVPPPREMWCVDPTNWQEYCEAWNFAMEQWLHHYLNIHYSDPLPTDLPTFPKECPSSCATW